MLEQLTLVTSTIVRSWQEAASNTSDTRATKPADPIRATHPWLQWLTATVAGPILPDQQQARMLLCVSPSLGKCRRHQRRFSTFRWRRIAHSLPPLQQAAFAPDLNHRRRA